MNTQRDTLVHTKFMRAKPGTDMGYCIELCTNKQLPDNPPYDTDAPTKKHSDDYILGTTGSTASAAAHFIRVDDRVQVQCLAVGIERDKEVRTRQLLEWLVDFASRNNYTGIEIFAKDALLNMCTELDFVCVEHSTTFKKMRLDF